VSENRVARLVVVHGRVQGVFFRDSCRREALEAGVDGWVSNAADGSLHAQFEGTSEGVERLVSWTRRGPRHATVERVDVHEVQVEGLSGFEVR
jgi:acylphosphatase